MKLVKVISAILFSIAAAVLCGLIIYHSLANQQYKNDYAELNSIKYGFLSIDVWNRQVTRILVQEIRKLDLSKTTEQDLRKLIEKVLGLLIDEVYQKIREENSSGIKHAFMNVFIKLDDIKKGIPEYTDAVMDEITKTETKSKVKNILVKKLEHYSIQTFDTQNTLQINTILRKTNTNDIESAKTCLKKIISANHDRIVKMTILLISLSIGLFLLAGFSRKPLPPSFYLLLVFTLLFLLLPGVTTPMIDLEAKISHLGFVLMGHPISFDDQGLYFQSKSILDVFRILITNDDLMMNFVGVLLINFSIFFPALKILSTSAYYYNYRHARENSIIRFFVLQSGKWSMADVMVVAIFMAYIGFNGIITNQFHQLSKAGPQVDLLTTNGTSLQPGYYLFLAYCLLGLFLSEFLTRRRPAGKI